MKTLILSQRAVPAKQPSSPCRFPWLRATTILLLTLAFLGTSAQAANIFWDIDGATTGSGPDTTPDGTWDDATANWTTSTTGALAPITWNDANNDTAVFSASTDGSGTFTISLSGTRTAGGITFEEGTVTISGGTQITLTGTAIINVAATAATISSVIGGTAGLTKSTGTGTLTLSGANTYTGVTTLNAGTLRATTSVDALGTGAATLALNAGTLQLADDTGLSFGRNTTVNGTTTINSDRTTSGAGVTHTLGTLSIGNGDTLNVTVGANVSSGTAGLVFGATTLSAATPIFNVASGANLTLGALSGNFAFTKQGNGQLTMNTTSGRTSGTVTLTAGTMKLGDVAALGTTGVALALNGGTLGLATDSTVNAYNATVGGSTTIQSDRATAGSGITHTLGTLSIGTFTLSVAAGANVSADSAYGLTFGATTISAKDAVFNVANNGTGLGTLTLGALSGNNDFTKQGSGTLELNSASTRSSSVTTLTAGTLKLGSTTALGNATSDDLQLSGGTLDLATDASVFSYDTTVNNTVTIASDRATGGAGITHTLGTLSIGTGDTLNVTAGSNVTIDTAYGLTFGATATANNGAVFDVANNGTGLGTLTLGVLSGDDDWSKQGAGTLVLNSASLNTSSLVTLTAGTLKLGSTTALGNTTTVDLQLNGGTLDLATDTSVFAYDTTVNNTATIASDRATGGAGITHTLGTLSIGAGDTLNVTAGSNVTIDTAYGLTFGATATSADGAVFDVANNGTGLGTLTLGVLSGGDNWSKQGAGTLVLNSASANTSSIMTLTAGTVKLGSTTALGNTATVDLQLNGGTLDLATDTSVFAYDTTVGGNTTIASDKATAASAGITHTLGTLGIGSQTLTVDRGANATGTAGLTFGAVTLSGSAVFNPSVNTLLTLASVTGAGQNFTVQGAGDTTISGAITTTTGNLTKSGVGTLTLSGNNTFTGGVSVNDGTLKLNNAGALNTATPNAVTMGGGTLSLNGNSVTISSLSGSSGTVNNNLAGTATLTINQAGSTAYAGTLADGGVGTLALTKTGGGTLALNTANSYTGGTTLSGGAITMGADNALGGSASAFAFAGGTLNSADKTFSIGALSLSADSTLNLGSSSTVDLTFASASWTAGTLVINNWTGTLGGSGTANQIFITSAPDLSFLNQVHFNVSGDLYFGTMNGTELVASIAAVPEPINVALGVFGVVFVGIGFARRFRKGKAAQ